LDQQQLARPLPAQANEQGVELIGTDGLLKQLMKRVSQTALEAEKSDHLGYPKHDLDGRNHCNSRNGVRSKTVLEAAGQPPSRAAGGRLPDSRSSMPRACGCWRRPEPWSRQFLR
jgi:hypothetical protein